MTIEQLNQEGFICNFEDKKIVTITYRGYLNDYDNSEVRMWAKECEEQAYLKGNESIDEYEYTSLEEDEQDNYTDIGKQPNGKFEIWYQKVNRREERASNLDEFDSEEEAELEIYRRTESWISEKNWNAPAFHSTKDDAIEDMASSFEKPKEVIERYLKIAAITDRKNKERREKATKECEARKLQELTQQIYGLNIF